MDEDAHESKLGSGIRLLLRFPALGIDWPEDVQPIVAAIRNKRYTTPWSWPRHAESRAGQRTDLDFSKVWRSGAWGATRMRWRFFKRALGADPGYLAALEGGRADRVCARRAEAIPLLDRLLKLRPNERRRMRCAP